MSFETKQSSQTQTEEKVPEEFALPVGELELTPQEYSHVIYLKSNDGWSFKTTVRCVLISTVLRNAIIHNDCFVPPNYPIQLNLTHVALKYVVDFLDHQNGVDPKEIEHPIYTVHHYKKCETKWLAWYCENLYRAGPKNVLLKVNNAAAYLGIPGLLSYTSSFIACRVKGKTRKTIIDIFGEEFANDLLN